MPGRRRTELTPERKARLIAELQVWQAAARRADEDLKVSVARANEAGMSLQAIADVLELKSADTARRWKVEGEQARDRRGDDGPGGPGRR